MSGETSDQASNDTADLPEGETGEIIQLIESRTVAVRGSYNSLEEHAVQDGSEQVVAFLDAVRKTLGNDIEGLDTVRDSLVRMVLTSESFADFRADTETDESVLAEKVDDALGELAKVTKRAKEGAEFLLDHVIPPSQLPRTPERLEDGDSAAERVSQFVSSSLQPLVGQVESVGDAEHFVAREGWRVPVTLRGADGNEHQATITIFDDGEIQQKTRGMLKQAFGLEVEED